MAGITKTIGGDRLGAGKKMQAHLHHYYRSTHDLSEDFVTSMGSGMLIPCLCKPAMRGDTFEIKINADSRTIPTLGPLFGSFKMQVDIFQCPVRLYQALLHNNPQAIGLNMGQIKFPIIELKTHSWLKEDYKCANNSLIKYLGFSGMGTPPAVADEYYECEREINAIPVLAYYDIYKNYYANKQEEKGYIIRPTLKDNPSTLLSIQELFPGWEHESRLLKNPQDADINGYLNLGVAREQARYIYKYKANWRNFNEDDLEGMFQLCRVASTWVTNEVERTLESLVNDGLLELKRQNYNPTTKEITIEYFIPSEKITDVINLFGNYDILTNVSMHQNVMTPEIQLQEFKLSNIDDMRYRVLSHHTLGTALKIGDPGETWQTGQLPYGAITSHITPYGSRDIMSNNFPLNGIALKTYQNDIYNNWLNADWIEGENGIKELSSVAVVDGKFSMDALSFAEKLYNMLNRVVIAGNTYEDWQDVVYEQVKRRQVESPIYCGGLSKEIVFDEIIQSAPADGDPLGTLGGRGRATNNQKGGSLFIKCDEACFIIGIVSLTPRVYYTQGNEFYMTDLKSLDDFHKPAMDGIGFQDLIGERLAWFDTQFDELGGEITRSKIGKIPAWLEYMTSVNKAYGDLAETEGKGYMILNRNYEQDEETGLIKDATTYIDPKKYNYIFAYDELDAQNFWVKISFDIKARRLMSARIIPNV